MEEIFFAICVVLFAQILIVLWFRSVLWEHTEEMKTFLKNLNEQKNILIKSAVSNVDEVKND